MGFVTPLLLGGLLLVGLPIVLHLMMRREPRLLEFPALQFVQSRRLKNQRNLHLRQVLLLLTRCAIIGLLAFALARPSYQGSGVHNKENAPISAILLLDNSLRMEYLHHNQTRLQAAQKLGDWLLAELPADSTVGVMDLTARKKRFSTDRMAARLQLSQIKTTGETQPLKEAVTHAIKLLKTRQKDRREIYILTDMTEVTWNSNTLSSIKNSLGSLQDLSLYLIDVGVPNARNRGLEKIKLSAQQITPNETLTLETILYKTALYDKPVSKKKTYTSGSKHDFSNTPIERNLYG